MSVFPDKYIHMLMGDHSQSNQRIDEYSCTNDNALHLLRRVVSSIRRNVPKSFILGVKINAADYVDKNSNSVGVSKSDDEIEKRALSHLQQMAKWGGVDFIEISGGDYEKPGVPPSQFIQTFCSPPQT